MKCTANVKRTAKVSPTATAGWLLSPTQGQTGAPYVLTDSGNNNQTDRHFPGEVLKLTPAAN